MFRLPINRAAGSHADGIVVNQGQAMLTVPAAFLLFVTVNGES